MDEPDWMGALAHLARGEAFTGIAGRSAFPTRVQWKRRLKKDAAFAAVVLALSTKGDPEELAQAQQDRVAAALIARWSEADYDALLSRVEAGESYHALVNKADGLPSARACDFRRKLDPDFDARVIAAMGLRKGVAAPEWVYTATLDAISAGASKRSLRHRTDLLSGETLRKRAETDAAFAARYRAAIAQRPALTHLPEAAYDDALQALRDGALCRELSAQGLLSGATINRRSRNDPAFRERYKAALASRARRAPAAEQRIEALSRDAVYAAADRAVARWLQSFERAEIISEIVLAVLEGDLDLADVPAAAAEFTAEHAAEYASPRFRSMDAPLSGEDGRTLHDVISA